MSNASNEYKVRGTTVNFPYTPYASQFAMLDKVLRSIKQSQNAILESPTGTGKTLALLCGSLAWQKAQYEPPSLKTPGCASDIGTGSLPVKATPDASTLQRQPHSDCQSVSSVQSPRKSQSKTAFAKTKGVVFDDDDDDDCDFQPTKRFRASVVRPPKVEEQSGDGPQHAPSAGKVIDEPATMPDGHPVTDVPSTIKKHGIPKIYYGTRTHKQIAQVIRELRKTAYCDVRMCILASREHTCIHPKISREPNLNEACREATAADIYKTLADRCGYYIGAAKMQERVEQTELGRGAWDLEDLLSVGRRRRMCPYYALRALKDRVDIIFCPYNYLIDPLVRKSFEINLSGQILILDEAHNIEDVAREAASLTITSETLQAALRDLEAVEKLHEDEGLQHSHHVMALMVSRLLVWLERRAANLAASSYEQSSDTLSGAAIVAELTELNMGPKDFGSLKNHYATVKVEESNTESGVKQKIARSTLVALDGLFTVLDFMYEDQLLHAEDYKVAVVKEMKPDNHGEEDTRRRRSRLKQVVSLNFWCFNPAVAFKHIKAVARSIILTSGTLSPMDSFHSELGISFPIKLEVGNFVKSSQLWSGAISVGPTSHSLNALFANTQSYQFQDEVGRALLRICQVVPHGVLCFVPSYSLLDKLMTRWEVTGLLLDLQEKKSVFCEPRGRRKADVTEVMRDYFETVDSCGNSDSGVQGALLMAVCRGKISEGMDFADEYARAVVTIGIPFPSYRDLQVQLKQEYNNAHWKKRGLLSGQQWYQTQGYRALNQALGRCIRHNNDWGAILLLDDRFAQSPSYTSRLSKWVRNSVAYYSDFDVATASLKQFMKSHEGCTSTPTPKRILPSPRRDWHDRSDFCPSVSSTPVKSQSASLRSSFEAFDLADPGSPLPGLSGDASSTTLLGIVASPAKSSGAVASPNTPSGTVLSSATSLGTVVCPATPSGTVSSSTTLLGTASSPATLPKRRVKTAVSRTKSPLATPSKIYLPVESKPRATAVKQSAALQSARAATGANRSKRNPPVSHASFSCLAELSRNWIFEITSASKLTHRDFLRTVDMCRKVLVRHPQLLSSSSHVLLNVGDKPESWKMEISSSEALDVGRCRSVLDSVVGTVTKGLLVATSKGHRLLHVRFSEATPRELPLPPDTHAVLFPFLPTGSEEARPVLTVEADSTSRQRSIQESGGSVVSVVVSPRHSSDDALSDAPLTVFSGGVVPPVAEKSLGRGSGNSFCPTQDASLAVSGREPWSPKPEADLPSGEHGTVAPETFGSPLWGTLGSSVSGRGFQSSDSLTGDLPLPAASNLEDVVQEVEGEYEAASPPPLF